MSVQRRKVISCFFALLVTSCLYQTLLIGAQEAPPINDPIASIETNLLINDADWSNDEIIAIASSGGLRLYESAYFLQLAEIQSGRTVYSTAWHPSGQQLAVSVADALEIWNWDGTNLSLEVAIPTNATHINLAWSPNGDYLASLEIYGPDGFLGQIYIWNRSNDWLAAVSPTPYYFSVDTHTNELLDWKFDSETLVLIGWSVGEINSVQSLTSNQSLFIIDASTFDILEQIEVPSLTRAVDWSPSGSHLAIGFGAGVKIYDTVAEEFAPAIEADLNNATIEWSPDGAKLLAGAFLVDVTSDVILGQYAVNAPLVADLWNTYGTAIFMAQRNGRLTIEDPALPQGFYATFTPQVTTP